MTSIVLFAIYTYYNILVKFPSIDKQEALLKEILDELVIALKESKGKFNENIQTLIKKYQNTYNYRVYTKKQKEETHSEESELQKGFAEYIHELQSNDYTITKELQQIGTKYEHLDTFTGMAGAALRLLKAKKQTEDQRLNRGLIILIPAIRSAKGQYTDEIDSIMKKYEDTKKFKELAETILKLVEIKIPEQSH